MALINCRECDRKVSDQATACPHCGAPVPTATAQADPCPLCGASTAKQTGTAQRPTAQVVSRVSRSVGFFLGVGILLFPVLVVLLLRQGHSTISRVIGFAWLAWWVFWMTSGNSPASTLPATSSKQSQPVMFEVNAQQLAQAYERNTVAADQQFKG